MVALETFFIKFETDNKQFRKGYGEVRKDLETVDKEAKTATESTKNLEHQFQSFGKTLATVGTSIAAYVGVSAGLRHVGDYALDLYQASKSLNVNQEALETWGRAVERFGGTQGGFQNSIRNLSNNLRLPASTIMGLLPEFAELFQRYDHLTAIRIGANLGLDEGLVLLLREGRTEVESLLEELNRIGLISSEGSQNIKKFTDTLSDSKAVLRTYVDEALKYALPHISEFQKKMQNLAIDLRQDPETFEAISKSIAAVGASASIAASGLVLFFSPFARYASAVIAVSAAIGYLVLDMEKFKQGKDSFISSGVDKIKDYSGKADDFLESIGLGFIKDISEEGKKELAENPNLPDGLLPQLKREVPGSEFFKSLSEQFENHTPASLGEISSNIIPGDETNNNKTINVSLNGDFNIQTQATNPDEIVLAVSGGIERQIRLAMSQIDDGVLI